MPIGILNLPSKKKNKQWINKYKSFSKLCQPLSIGYKTWEIYFNPSKPLNYTKKRTPKQNQIKDVLFLWMGLNSVKQVCALKRNRILRQDGDWVGGWVETKWEWYLSLGWCCFVVAWWPPGCWGSVRGPERWRWDAGTQPTGAVRLGGRAKWLSYPGDCEHTTSLNISASLTPQQPDAEENARRILARGPALPVLPDVHVTSALTEPNVWGLWQEHKLSGHVLSWMKLAETTVSCKTSWNFFSVCLQTTSFESRVLSALWAECF